jgi:hypothetical protein
MNSAFGLIAIWIAHEVVYLFHLRSPVIILLSDEFEVEYALVLTGIVQADDILMLQRADGLRLASQAFQRFHAARFRATNGFERNRTFDDPRRR